MNARPYIFGCLCLVGAIGTAAASDVSVTNSLLSLGRSVSSSFDAGSTSRSSSSQSSRDGGSGDVTTARQVNNAQASPGQAPMPPPVEADADMHDGSSSGHGAGPTWQSMLPGSIF
ncbi:hypothetical protein [Luteibacter sp. 9133]|uniref:hypothetical protein n=1 Tax=Luteibacter sp. 9133 TaxID=1500891 RepID=UPI0005BA208F|nr:hypothetical protein [Luteibacter sp. 9133]